MLSALQLQTISSADKKEERESNISRWWPLVGCVISPNILVSINLELLDNIYTSMLNSISRMQ